MNYFKDDYGVQYWLTPQGLLRQRAHGQRQRLELLDEQGVAFCLETPLSRDLENVRSALILGEVELGRVAAPALQVVVGGPS